MIDVLIDADGGITVAHDEHSLPRLKALHLDRDSGDLAYVSDDDQIGHIGSLLPVMVTAVAPDTAPKVIRLNGFTPEAPYSCELLVL